MTNNENDTTERTESTQPGTTTAAAGAPRINIKEPAVASQVASGNEEFQWMQQHDKEKPQPTVHPAWHGDDKSGSVPEGRASRKRVERKTFLRGQAIDPPRHSKQSVRRRTERDMIDAEFEIPYTPWEKATRSLVCAIIERQDRVSEQLLLMVNDLQYRVDDLEQDREANAHNKGRVP